MTQKRTPEVRLWPLPRAACKAPAGKSSRMALAIGAVLISSSLTLKAQLPVRINSGGGSFVDVQSRTWSADYAFAGGSTYATVASIDGTLDDILYQTERYEDFSYAIPLSNGTYNVTLHFAEVYWNGAGLRLFDVKAEGVIELDDLDIWQSIGQLSAMTQSFSVVVSDGMLNLDFFSEIDQAKLSALEVHDATTTEGSPLLVLSPASVDFGSAYVGQTSSVHSIALANHGDTLLNVTSFLSWGANQYEFLLPDDAPLAINPGETVSVDVAFAPWYPGEKMANMLVFSDEPISPRSVSLSGVGDTPPLPEPDLLVSPVALDFGTWEAGTSSTPVTVTLASRGNHGLSVYSIEIAGPHADAFSLEASAPYFLIPGQTATVTVAFAPTNAGAVDATLVIESGTRSSPDTVMLEGFGRITLPGSTVARINCGGGSYTDSVGEVWTPDNFFLGGFDYSLGAQISGTTDPYLYQSERYGDFFYIIPVSNGAYRVVLHFAEIFWDAAEQRVFDIRQENTLVVNDLDIWQEVGKDVAHTQSFDIAVFDSALNLDFITETDNAKVSAIEILPLGLPPQPKITVQPTTLDFGPIQVGLSSTPLDVTLSSSGDTILSIDTISLIGPFAGNFDLVESAPYALIPGQTATVSVTFMPTNTGVLAANMSISSDAPGSPDSVSLSGTSVTQEQQLVAIPPNVNFGVITIGDSAPQVNVTVSNVDFFAHNLDFAQITDNGGLAFALTPQTPEPLLLQPGDVAVYQVGFAPQAVGTTGAMFTAHFDSQSLGIDVPLSGTGQAPSVPTNVAIRINAGGPQYTDPIGHVWQPDDGFYNTGMDFDTSASIQGTTMELLYQSERWDPAGSPEMTYNFAVPNGEYRVRLHFAEVFAGTAAAGARVFSIEIEGQTAYADYDIFADVGFLTATVKESMATITDGSLDITFIHNVENPKISAIEILTPDASLTNSPTLIEWGHIAVGSVGDVRLVELVNSGTVPAVVDQLGFVINAGVGHDFVATVNGTDYAGDHEDVFFPVNLVVAPGTTQLVPVVFMPTEESGNDVWLEFSGNFPTLQTRLIGIGSDNAGHPYLHVVIRTDPVHVDYDQDGFETVFLEGADSHTHEFGHVLTQFEWRVNGGLVSTSPDTLQVFPLGTQTVSLTIYDDNTPPETLTGSTSVRVATPSAVPGALVAYYDSGTTNPVTLLDTVPMNASFGERQPSMPIGSLSGFIGTSPYTGQVLVVVSAQIDLQQSGSYDFQLTGGLDTRLFVNGLPYLAPLPLFAGMQSIEARFAVGSLSDLPLDITYAVDGGVQQATDPSILTHDETTMLPVLNTAPTGGLPTGGYPISITGLGFIPLDQVNVHWGTNLVLTTVDFSSVADDRIDFIAPAGEGTIPITVQTPNGTSRTVFFAYDITGPAPINFALDPPISVSSPTHARWGPDGRLYVANIYGDIHVYTFDDNYNVTDHDVSTAIANTASPQILGMAFNPFDSPGGPVRIYVAHNLLFANGGSCFTNVSPYSGQVSVLEGPNFDTVQPLITGLPVSNHDHGINGMEFDNEGNLLIAVGGNSNAGVPDCDIGGVPESPLSAAIIKAYVTRTNFNGNIVYVETQSGQVNMDQAYGDIVDVATNIDIEVFASGMRNAYDLVLTTAGLIYSPDNGPNTGFGPASLSATTQGPEADDEDTLDLIEAGHYYGHPNRNRGRYDARQNVYHDSADAPIPGVFTQGLGVYLSSVNGIDEYRAKTFNFAMYKNLLLQKWNDETHRIVLSPNGRSIASTTILPAALDALDVIVGPGGVVIGVDYSSSKFVVAKPVDVSAVGPTAYDIFPWRAPEAGGNEFVIGGSGFGTLANTMVTIGGIPATLNSVSANRIRGTIPAAPTVSATLLDVVVMVDQDIDVIPDAFLYLAESMPQTDARAVVTVDAESDINQSSTYNADSFQVDNVSPSQKISRVVIDLSQAMLPDIVFDPYGFAGDPVGKDFTVDTDPGVGVVTHNFIGLHDGGYDALEVLFDDFDPGESIGFSIDIDPTSIQGASPPGPNHAGSISGMEMTGSDVLVEFDDGAILQSKLFAEPGSDVASACIIKHDMAAAPVVDVLGVGSGPTNVNDASQIVRIMGIPGSTAAVIVVEAALYVQGVPGGGFDLDPYEANTALSIAEYSATIGPVGHVDVPVTLTNTDPDGGLNHIVAVIRDDAGENGIVAEHIILQLGSSESASLPPQGGAAADPSIDSDGDGLSGDIEELLGTNPFKADSDGDGLNDLEELYAGTDPTDADSTLQFTSDAITTLDGPILSWDTVNGRLYTLYRAASPSGPWTAIHQVHGDGSRKSYLIPAETPHRCLFKLTAEY